MIDSCINKFLSKKYDIVRRETEDQEKLYFSLPFFGPQSEKMRKELLTLLTRSFPNVKFICSLTNSNNISKFFNHKDKLPKYLRASVVYKYVCPRCGSLYVGSSSRTLGVRSREHAGVSYRTGNPLSQPPQSAIRDHTISCTSPTSLELENFSIIGTSSNITELRILESIHIFKLKPILNNTISAHPLYILSK